MKVVDVGKIAGRRPTSGAAAAMLEGYDGSTPDATTGSTPTTPAGPAATRTEPEDAARRPAAPPEPAPRAAAGRRPTRVPGESRDRGRSRKPRSAPAATTAGSPDSPAAEAAAAGPRAGFRSVKIRTALDAELDDAVHYLSAHGYEVSRASITSQGLRHVLDQIKSDHGLDAFPRRPQRKLRPYVPGAGAGA